MVSAGQVCNYLLLFGMEVPSQVNCELDATLFVGAGFIHFSHCSEKRGNEYVIDSCTTPARTAPGRGNAAKLKMPNDE